MHRRPPASWAPSSISTDIYCAASKRPFGASIDWLGGENERRLVQSAASCPYSGCSGTGIDACVIRNKKLPDPADCMPFLSAYTDIVSTLRAAHGAEPTDTRMGVDVLAGAAGDMSKLGIFESYRVKKQVRLLLAIMH